MDRLDAMLEGLPRHDVPDRALDEVMALIAAEPRAAAPTAMASPQRSARGRIGLLIGVGLAASLTLAAGLGLRTPEDAGNDAAPPMTIRGAGLVGSNSASMELGLSLLRDQVPVALGADTTARGSDAVLLRYTTDREGFAYVLRLDPAGALEVVHGTPTLPGTHHVTVDGKIVGYPLAELTGAQRFAVAWSHDPWAASETPSQAATAPQGLADALHSAGAFPRALRGSLAGIVVDAQDVVVDGAR